MEKKEKIIYLYITYAVFLVSLIVNFDLVISALKHLSNLFMPIFVGMIIAFVLNVPVTGFEKLFQRVFRNRKYLIKDRTIHHISIILSVSIAVIIIVMLLALVVPELVTTIKDIIELIENKIPDLIKILESNNVNSERLKSLLSDLDVQNNIDGISKYTETVLGSIANVATSTASVIYIAITGIIIAIYALFERDRLTAQTKKVLSAFLKPKLENRIIRVCRLVKKSYMKFFTVQCLEAIILGVLITIAFTIFRLPYATLVGVVTTVCSLIPYVGAFISCSIGVILTLMVSPQKALTSLVVYLVVQFIETQFIYPRVVGSSVGLSPLCTLIAVIIGGKLFGLIGMIFFIPLISVIYTLTKESVAKRLRNKNRQTC